MRSKSLMARLMSAPYVLWSVLFILAPLAFVLYYAFTDRNGSFTLGNIKQLGSASYADIFMRSASFALAATAICLLVAYPLAYAVARAKPGSQKNLYYANYASDVDEFFDPHVFDHGDYRGYGFFKFSAPCCRVKTSSYDQHGRRCYLRYGV